MSLHPEAFFFPFRLSIFSIFAGMSRETFRKTERITSEKTISFLFERGESFFEYPFRVMYSYGLESPPEYGVEIAISVPRRRIRSAVKRNRIKRQVRECYRKAKQPLAKAVAGKNLRLSVFFIFVGTADVKHEVFREKINLILNRLEEITLNRTNQEGT